MTSPPPHAFSPFLQFIDESDLFMFDMWQGTGLTGVAYFAARNDAVPLIVASQANDIAAVQRLLSSTNLNVDEVGLEGETALHMACALGHSRVVDALLSTAVSPNAVDHAGSTPLIHCTRFCPEEKSLRVASALLNSGADPVHVVTVDMSRYLPLSFAIEANNMSLVHLLAPLTPLNFPRDRPQNYITNIAISNATRHTDTTILEFLINSGLPLEKTDICKAFDDQTFSLIFQNLHLSSGEVSQMAPHILHNTWTSGRSVILCMERLVQQYQLDINERDIQIFVVSVGSVELLKASIELGLDLKSVPLETVREWIDPRRSEEFDAIVEQLTMQCGRI